MWEGACSARPCTPAGTLGGVGTHFAHWAARGHHRRLEEATNATRGLRKLVIFEYMSVPDAVCRLRFT